MDADKSLKWLDVLGQHAGVGWAVAAIVIIALAVFVYWIFQMSDSTATATRGGGTGGMATATGNVVNVNLVPSDRASPKVIQQDQEHPETRVVSTGLRYLEWREGDREDPRFDYRKWSSVVFMIDASHKQHARAFIETKRKNAPDRRRADIAANNWHTHEAGSLTGYLRPGEQYHVPVFLTLDKGMHLWLDEQKQYDGFPLPNAPLGSGSYVTDSNFLGRILRSKLNEGVYTLRVVVIVGDDGHSTEHTTKWREFKVG